MEDQSLPFYNIQFDLIHFTSKYGHQTLPVILHQISFLISILREILKNEEEAQCLAKLNVTLSWAEMVSHLNFAPPTQGLYQYGQIQSDLRKQAWLKV